MQVIGNVSSTTRWLSSPQGRIETTNPDWSGIFGNSNPLVVEIGFGMGTTTAQIALANPGVNYIGFEVFVAGIGKLLWEIDRQQIPNIRIVHGDAASLIPLMIADNSLSAVHIFFPDPWPKKKHHKRRLVQRPFTDLLAAKLRPGAHILMATDWPNYAESAQSELSATPGLVQASPASIPSRPVTKFERKGIAAGREIHELVFRKA
jgi:tRNA (guanine-N7-)-methyltransferase